jgi:hypothetical protein
MAMTKITPTLARVRWDRQQHRPGTVQVGERRLRVTAVDSVRDETSAYPVDRGPRLTFLLETDAGQASLVYDGRRRRWFVEAWEAAAA